MNGIRMTALSFLRRHFPAYPAVWVDDLNRYVVCIVDPSDNRRLPMGVCWFDENEGWPTFHTLSPADALELSMNHDDAIQNTTPDI